jgi:hypothetical protein
MQQRAPLGLSDGPPARDGFACLGGAVPPGPLGVVTGDGTTRPAASSTSRSESVDQAAGHVSASFTLGSDVFRLVRLDGGWRHGFDEVRVRPAQAMEIIQEAWSRFQSDHELALLLATAASQLAEYHDGGVFVLLQKRPQYSQGVPSGSSSAVASTPAAFRPPESPAPMAPVDEDPMMGVEQAMVLKRAAADGVPFCEECARRRAM